MLPSGFPLKDVNYLPCSDQSSANFDLYSNVEINESLSMGLMETPINIVQEGTVHRTKPRQSHEEITFKAQKRNITLHDHYDHCQRPRAP